MYLFALYCTGMAVLLVTSVLLLVAGIVGYVRQRKAKPDILSELITEGQYFPWVPYDEPTSPEGYN